MNTIEPNRLQELVHHPEQLLHRIGSEGVSFRTGRQPSGSDTASSPTSPGAVVLCCSDMLELPERILGSALGPIYALQSAGALLTPTMEASVRYALATSEARVLAVLGHRRCRLIEHCWIGKPRPHVLGDLLRPAFEQALRTPDCDLDGAVEATIRHNAARARDLAQGLQSSLARPVAVVVALYDDLDHRVTLTAAEDVSRVLQPPLTTGDADVQ